MIINCLIAAAAALVAASGIFYIASLINKNLEEVLDFKNGIRGAREEILALTVLRQEADANAAAFDKLKRVLPVRDDLVLFRKNFEGLAHSKNLKFGFSFGAELPPNGTLPGAVMFDMALEGSLKNITAFLREFEVANYITELSQFNVTGDGNVFSGRTSGKVFFSQ